MAALCATPWRPFGGQGRHFDSKNRVRKSNLKKDEKRDWIPQRSAAEAGPPIDLLHRSFYIDQGYLVTACRTQGAAPDLHADASAADLYRLGVSMYGGSDLFCGWQVWWRFANISIDILVHFGTF